VAPDASKAEVAKSDTTSPDGAKTDAAHTDVPQPGATLPDATPTTTAKNDAAKPATTAPDPSKADAPAAPAQPQTTVVAQNSPPANAAAVTPAGADQAKTQSAPEPAAAAPASTGDALEASLPPAESLTAGQQAIHLWLGDKGGVQGVQDAFDGPDGLKRKFAPLLDDYALEVRRFDGSSTVYRIFVGPIDSLQKAQEICGKIKQRDSGQMCRTAIN
jgi:hypothetical protein